MGKNNWINEWPSNWELVRFRSAYRFSRGLDIKKQDLGDHGMPVISYGQIHAKDNPGVRVLPAHVRLIPDEFVKLGQVERAHLSEGDIVFADTSEDIEGSGNMVRVSASDDLFAGYHTLIARPTEEFRHEYMAYQMISPSWRRQVQRAVQGVKVYSITQGIFNEITLLKPPIIEQQAIAGFLSVRTAEIDRLVEKLQREVQLLERYRRELIAHTVTRGLNPDVPMQDSRIDWIGVGPVAWTPVSAKAIFMRRTEFERAGDVHLTPSQMFGVLPQEEFIAVSGVKPTLKFSDSVKMKHVEPGDFIIHLRSFQGGLEYSEYQGKVSAAYTVITPRNDQLVDRSFFRWLFKSTAFIKNLSSMTNQLRDGQSINFKTFSKTSYLLPSLVEQQEIAAFLNEKTFEIDSALSGIKRQTELLRKYRKQVINDAVTGKVRVGEVA
ncbi:MAG: restriction endonuclease subunit S [Schaalia turicensis]